MTHTDFKSETQWFGCYGPRGDLFLPESNVHPAKMAVGLCYRIFEHGRQRGYWQPGDVILDPMAGIFTTGIVGASLGFHVVGVELEHHFLVLARKNVELLLSKMLSAPVPVLLGGDARRLAALLTENKPYLDGWQQGLDDNKAAAAVTSPPYTDADLTGARQFRSRHETERPAAARNPHEGYGGVVSSPPYGDTAMPSAVRAEIRAVARAGRIEEAVAMLKAQEVGDVERKLVGAHVHSDAGHRRRITEALEREQGNYSARVESGGGNGHREQPALRPGKRWRWNQQARLWRRQRQGGRAHLHAADGRPFVSADRQPARPEE